MKFYTAYILKAGKDFIVVFVQIKLLYGGQNTKLFPMATVSDGILFII